MNKKWKPIIFNLIMITLAFVAGGFVGYGYLQSRTNIAESPAFTVDMYSNSLTVMTKENDDLTNLLKTNPPSPQGIADISQISSYSIGTIEDTGSMEPTLNKDSRVLFAIAPIKVGDIICWDTGIAGWWCHRIIGETSDSWITQGDANRYDGATEIVPKDTVIYRVMAIVY